METTFGVNNRRFVRFCGWVKRFSVFTGFILMFSNNNCLCLTTRPSQGRFCRRAQFHVQIHWVIKIMLIIQNGLFTAVSFNPNARNDCLQCSKWLSTNKNVLLCDPFCWASMNSVIWAENEDISLNLVGLRRLEFNLLNAWSEISNPFGNRFYPCIV